MKYCPNCGKPKGKYDEDTGKLNKNYCNNPCCAGHIYDDGFWSSKCIRCGKPEPLPGGTDL